MTEIIRRKIDQLVEMIRKHDHAYFVLNAPEITDAQYDSLIKQLIDLEKEYPQYRDENTPTARVGSDTESSFNKVAHTTVVGSLNKAHAVDSVVSWYAGLKLLDTIVAMPKVDGLSLVLHYMYGHLSQAITRGDGVVGDDVTDNARTIKNIPLFVEDWRDIDHIYIRGEVYISKHDFEKINTEYEFSNARNAAAGSLKNKKSSVTATRNLKFVAFDILGISGTSGSYIDSITGHLYFLDSNGFETVPRMTCKDQQGVKTTIEYYTEFRDTFDYEIDGVVFRLDNNNVFFSAGVSGQNPKGAIAYKFKAKSTITRLLNVEYTVGRYGKITPVATLEPVDLAGVTVSKASLHNFNNVQDLDIRLGDMVILERAGDVIPQVVSSLADDRIGNEIPVIPPAKCPFCGSPVERKLGFVDYLCTGGDRCTEQVIRRLVHFVGKSGMDIPGFGEQTVRDLVSWGFVRTFADIYTLEPDALAVLQGFTMHKATKLCNAIDQSKNRPFDQVLAAFGIEGVGSTISSKLVKAFSSVDRMLDAGANAVDNLSGVGPYAAFNLVSWLKINKDMLYTLKELGINLTSAESISSTLSGLSFVITGSFDKPRIFFEQLIKNNGGLIKSSVSRNTNYLLLGKNPGSKLKKAESLGITILNKEEFLSMIETNGVK